MFIIRKWERVYSPLSEKKARWCLRPIIIIVVVVVVVVIIIIIVTECLTSDIFSMLLCGDSDCRIIVCNINLAP